MKNIYELDFYIFMSEVRAAKECSANKRTDEQIALLKSINGGRKANYFAANASKDRINSRGKAVVRLSRMRRRNAKRTR